MSSPVGDVVSLDKEQQPLYAPDFQLNILDQQLPPSVVRDIIEIRYEDALERVDGFTLIVNNWNAATRRPIYFGYDEGEPANEHPKFFEPGSEVQLFLGYAGDLRLMMTGFITSVDVQFAESGHSKLVVSGLNILDRFRRQQYTWSWPDDGREGIRDSDVALALAPKPNDAQHRPGLGIQVQIDEAARASEPLQPNVYMNNQYPILFLMERARARGYEVLLGEEADAKGKVTPHLYFGPTRSLRAVTYRLEWGKTLVSFHPTFCNAQQVAAVKVTGWDRTAKKPILVRRTLDQVSKESAKLANKDHIATAKSAAREEVITDPPALNEAEAKARADARLLGSMDRMVEATGVTVGLPDLRAGRSVIINKTGKHFDGQYTVVSSTHVLNDAGYRTTFTARRVGPEKTS